MPETSPRYRVAAVQAAPVFLDRDGCVEKACRLIGEAGTQDARLIVLPETWIPGYPVWTNAVSRWDHGPSKRTYARLYRNAVDVPGPVTEELGRAARAAGAYVVVGVHERVPTGTLYNTLVFLAPDGSLLGKHRKLVPTYHERMVWAHGDASTLQTFPTELGRLGGLICWEHWMPLARYALEAEGMQVAASVWPSAGETFLIAARHLAHEGRCFVVVACSYMTKAHLPAVFELTRELESMPNLLHAGGSAIIGPDGRFLAGPVYEQETTLCAEVDLDRILEEKQTLDVAGHYARPELFRLLVDREAKTPLAQSTPGGTVGAIHELPLQDTRESPLQGAAGADRNLAGELERLAAMVDKATPRDIKAALRALAAQAAHQASPNPLPVGEGQGEGRGKEK